MGIALFVLIVLLIGQVGFWHTLGAILGTILMIPLVIILVIAVIYFTVMLFFGGPGRTRRY